MIFYATKNDNNKNSNENFEYEVILEDGIHRYFLDFYIKDNNKIIEFDGDYWHGEKRGNQQRDRYREKLIFEAIPGIQLKRVKERDYRKNPEKIVNECVEWILENEKI